MYGDLLELRTNDQGTFSTFQRGTPFAFGPTSYTLGSITVGSIPFAGSNNTLSQDATNFLWDNTAKALSVGGLANQTNFPGTVCSMSLGSASLGYTQHIITDPTAAGQSVYVCNANDATNTTHYCQLSMNNSVSPNPANVFFTNIHAAALYTTDNDLYLYSSPQGSNPTAIVHVGVNGITDSLTITPTAATLGNGAVFFPLQLASAPTYVRGGMYFDTTLNKLRIGGVTAWETVTSV